MWKKTLLNKALAKNYSGILLLSPAKVLELVTHYVKRLTDCHCFYNLNVVIGMLSLYQEEDTDPAESIPAQLKKKYMQAFYLTHRH